MSRKGNTKWNWMVFLYKKQLLVGLICLWKASTNIVDRSFV